MKNKSSLSVVIFGLALLPALAAAQQQRVSPVPSAGAGGVGDRVTTTISYSTSPIEPSLPGLGLRIHWPSDLLTLVAVRGVLPDGLIAQGTSEPDSEDFDGDPRTDRLIHLAWADLGGAWPGTDQADLLTIELEVLAQLTEPAVVRFSSSSTASGYEFVPTPFEVRPEALVCRPDQDTLCLRDGRFQVEVGWRDFDGNRGQANVVPVGSRDSGLFWFFSDDNWEMLVKVLNGCSINNHFWFLSASATNVELDIVLTDLVTGVTKTYNNPLGERPEALIDTRALATCASGNGPLEDGEIGYEAFADLLMPPMENFATIPKATGCISGSTSMCLRDQRFRVEVDWQTSSGNTGLGRVVPFGSPDSGLFWFFSEDNWEMLVKVLDGCEFNNRYWVFAATASNVGFTLRVTDEATGLVKEYSNPVGNPASAITDTNAFTTCP